MNSWRCGRYSILTVEQAGPQEQWWAEHIGLRCESSPCGEAELQDRMNEGRFHPECLEASEEEAKTSTRQAAVGNAATSWLPGSSSKILGQAPSVSGGLDRAKGRTWGERGKAGQRYNTLTIRRNKVKRAAEQTAMYYGLEKWAVWTLNDLTKKKW